MQKSPCGPTAPPDLLPAASVSLPRETQARSQFELVGRLWGSMGGRGSGWSPELTPQRAVHV